MELLHGDALEQFRKTVDEQKESEGKHNWEWAKSFIQSPLETKIQVATQRILEWILYYEGKVYVGFSGGVDSTVLLDLVRRVYPDCPAVFCDTGLEYPEIRDFVRTFENVEWLHPMRYNNRTKSYDRVSFKQIIDEYGYPLPTKEIAETVYRVRNGNSRTAIEKITGTMIDPNTNKKSKYNCEKWKFLLDAPFKISNKCCNYMKKTPFKEYEKRTGNHAIVGTTVYESMSRRVSWLNTGCNSFSSTPPFKTNLWMDKE